MKNINLPSALALFGILALGSSQSVRANPELVVNGGFEDGDFTGWTQSGNMGFTGVDSINNHSGGNAADLGPFGSLGFLSQTLTTAAATNYVLDFWLDNQGGIPNSFSVSWDGAAIPSPNLGTNLGTFGYTEYTFTVAGTGAPTALQFGFQQDATNFFLDDVSVQAVSSSSSSVPDAGSTSTLLGLAVLGLAAVRRKLS